MIIINNNKGNMKGGSLVKLSLLDKTLKKYVLGHLGFFCLWWRVMVLTETFQVFMMFRWFQDYSLSIYLRKEAGRKEWGVQKKKKKKETTSQAVRCGLHLSLLQQRSCSAEFPAAVELNGGCSMYVAVTKVRCGAQGLSTTSLDCTQRSL